MEMWRFALVEHYALRHKLVPRSRENPKTSSALIRPWSGPDLAAPRWMRAKAGPVSQCYVGRSVNAGGCLITGRLHAHCPDTKDEGERERTPLIFHHSCLHALTYFTEGCFPWKPVVQSHKDVCVCVPKHHVIIYKARSAGATEGMTVTGMFVEMWLFVLKNSTGFQCSIATCSLATHPANQIIR